MKKIAILGSTGSIGKTTLNVIRRHRDLFKVMALAAHSSIDLMEKQANEFNPQIIAIFDENKAKILRKRLPNIKIVSGLEGLIEAAISDNDFVMSGIMGSIGLIPTIEAIKAKKTIGLANKEVLVAAGELVNKLIKENGVDLIPVDSEHNAIFQCLKNENSRSIKRLIITASGGPFFKYPKEKLSQITYEDALTHPTYKMGKKITIDSSTLMNKGLEVIEAYHLFNIEKDQIDVVIHPQSIIHSMVEFIDSSILAQMSEPNMEIPIQYSLSYPKRVKSDISNFDFTKNQKLEFFEPNKDKFLCFFLALQSLKIGKSMPCYMNAANEILVNRFLNKEISWLEISKKLEKLMTSHTSQNVLDLQQILEIDKQARKEAQSI